MSSPPTPYTRESDFTLFAPPASGQVTVGADLNSEFNALVTSVDETQDRLAEIQREDGALANLSVHPDAFSAASLALIAADWTPRNAFWTAATVYDVGDVVEVEGNGSYVAGTAHTAAAAFLTDYTAGYWIALGSNSFTVDTDGTLAANSDARVASQKATKTYADTKIGGDLGATANKLIKTSGTGGKTAQVTQINVASGGEIDGYAGSFNDQTGTTYTMQASDTGKIVTFSNAGAITVTLPETLLKGFCCTWEQKGAGQVTFAAGSGATLRNRQTQYKSAGQYAAGALFVDSGAGTAANFVLAGDTAA